MLDVEAPDVGPLLIARNRRKYSGYSSLLLGSGLVVEVNEENAIPTEMPRGPLPIGSPIDLRESTRATRANENRGEVLYWAVVEGGGG